MRNLTSNHSPLMMAALAICGGLLLARCAGEGLGFDNADAVLTTSCVMCHDSQAFDALLKAVDKIPADKITAERFPDAHFPAGLIVKDVATLRTEGEPAADAKMAPDTPLRKAWLLHELHELQGLLAEDVPPDFTDQARFDAFSKLGEAGAWEGCEVAEKLELGAVNDPEGMPPRWAHQLSQLVDMPYENAVPGDRQAVIDYVARLLPGGLAACTAVEEGS